jgi:ABC-type branched-subunit amino acid transport system substrate-binding protein
MNDSSRPGFIRGGSRRDILKAGIIAGASTALGTVSGLRGAFAADPYKLGWIRPTTGPLASTFAELFAPADIALDEINASGGILGRQLVRVEEDDQASPAAQPAIVKKLAEAGCNCIVGPVGTSQSLASLATSTPLKMISCGYVTASAMGDPAKYPYHYFLFMTIEMEAETGIAYAIDELKLKKVAILAESSAFGDQITAATKASLAKRGLEPVAVQSAPVTAPDVSGYLRNLRASGAEAVMMWFASKPFAARVFSGMGSMEWLPEAVIGHGIVLDPATMDNASPELLPRITSPYFKTLTWGKGATIGDRQMTFAKKLAAVKGLTPTPNIAMGPWYDFLYLLKQGIETSKSFESDEIKRGMDSIKNYDGLLGNISFSDKSHIGLPPDALCMVSSKSGKDAKAMGIFRERV